jgi:hypothetical protein
MWYMQTNGTKHDAVAMLLKRGEQYAEEKESLGNI